MWSIGAGLNNVTFRNNFARPHPGQNCCFVSFGGQLSSFIDSHGEGCGLTPRRGIGHGNEGLVVWGSPSANPRLFGGAWNSSSTAVVRQLRHKTKIKKNIILDRFSRTSRLDTTQHAP